MKTASLLFCLLLLNVMATSCRHRAIRSEGGPSKSESRDVTGEFTRISIAIPADAIISVGPDKLASFQIDGPADILKYVKTRIVNSELQITIEDHISLDLDQNFKVAITLPSLTGLDISGSGKAVVEGVVASPKLSLQVAGSGDIEVKELKVTELDGEIAGSGTLTIIAGVADKAEYDIAGAGEVQAYGLATQETKIDVAGSGEAYVNATTLLDIDVAGSGSVSYKGNPQIHQDIAGSGSVSKAQ